MPSAQAFVAEISTNENRSRAYGWLTTAQYGGLIIGPAVAWPLYALGGGHGARAFYAILLFGTVIMLAAALALAVYLREPDRARREQSDGELRLPIRSLLTRPIAAIILVVAMAQFASGGFQVVWSIPLRDLDASITVIGLTWVLFSAPLLLSFVGGHVADRRSRFAHMFTGFGIQGMEQTAMPLAALIGTATAPLLHGWREAGVLRAGGTGGAGRACRGCSYAAARMAVDRRC